MTYRAGRVSVAELITAAKLEIGDGYRAKNSELTDNGLPFARAGNISGGFNFENVGRFPTENIGRVGRKVSQPGDVVFTSKGTVGRFALVSEETERFVYSPQLSYWRSLDHQLIDPRYLFYWMQSADFHAQFKSVSSQTDMAEYVSLRDQRRMQLFLPPLDEQRRIAHILGTLDDKIELNRQMNKTLDEIARTLFRSWFVDFDPVRAKMEGRQPECMDAATAALFPDRLVDSELGPIPEGWEWKPLDQIGDFINGLALQKFPPRNDGTDLPVIKIAQLRAQSTLGAASANCDVPSKYHIEDGDLLFSWSGSLLAAIWTGGIGALNQHLFKVTTDFPQWFIYHWVLEHLDEFRRVAADKATTMGHINRRHLSAAMCAVPIGDLVINEADACLGSIATLRLANSLESKTLAELRDALLPQLIAGQSPLISPVSGEQP